MAQFEAPWSSRVGTGYTETIVLGVKWVAVVPFELKLGPNESYGRAASFGTPPGATKAQIRAKIIVKLPIHRPGGRYLIEGNCSIGWGWRSFLSVANYLLGRLVGPHQSVVSLPEPSVRQIEFAGGSYSSCVFSECVFHGGE